MTAPTSSYSPAAARRGRTAREMLNKVPEVTLYFWVIKVLCTTVGETASDYLSGNVGLGLTKTTFITGALLIAALVLQFRANKYVPQIYWLGIVLISVVGTQITDNLSDNYGVSLVVTATIFAIALAITFAVWFAFEVTLSIHTIFTTRRESFYWLAVLFTFSLGTAAGDLTSERLNLGYLTAVLIFAALIAAVTAAYYRFGMNAIAAFWIAYILSRPLGASIGDYLSQPRADGGLGLGTTVTSFVFLGAIIAVATFLAITRRDVTELQEIEQIVESRVLVLADRTGPTPLLLDAVRSRASLGPVRFHLVVPDPARHPELTDAERARGRHEAEEAAALALSAINDAAGTVSEVSLSTRHDPMDALEEELHRAPFDELILSTLPHYLTGWLHVDLAHRVAHLGLPITIITAAE